MTYRLRLAEKVGAVLLVITMLLSVSYQATYAFFTRPVTSTTNIFTTAYWANLQAAIDLKPETLNLKSTGQPVTCYIEFPIDANLNDIVVESILLEGTLPVQPEFHEIGDYDGDGVPDLMVKFDRQSVNTLLSSLQGPVTLHVSGAFSSGKLFEGSDTIYVIHAWGAPKNLQVNDLHTGDQLYITWQPPDELMQMSAQDSRHSIELTYHLYRSLVSGAGYELVMSGTATEFIDTGLSFKSLYYYIVKVVEEDGSESEPSLEGCARPSSNTATPTVTITAEPTQSASPGARPTASPPSDITPEPTLTASPTELPTAAEMPTVEPSLTAAPSATATPTAEPSLTAAPSATATPTAEPGLTVTPQSTALPPPVEPDPTETPCATALPPAEPSQTGTPGATSVPPE